MSFLNQITTSSNCTLPLGIDCRNQMQGILNLYYWITEVIRIYYMHAISDNTTSLYSNIECRYS